jgi:hypothetical protein
MLSKADGKKFDLDKAGGLSEAAGKNPNPYSAEMNIASSQAGAMNAATKAYIDGNNAAAAAIGKLQGVITSFIESPIGQYASRVNAMVQTGMEDNAVQGALHATMETWGAAQDAGTALKDIPFIGNALGSAVQGGATVAAGSIWGDILGTGSKKGDWQSNTSQGVKDAGFWGGILQGINSFFKGGEDSTVNTGGTKDTTGAFKIIKPVPGARVTAGYNAVGGAHSSPHKGIDYGVSIGTKVIAAASGTVKSASGSTANTYGQKGSRSFGLRVVIDHGNGYTTTYAHLSSAQVSGGMQVQQGQVIALSGNSGYSTGPHLHFQVEKNGVPIDPNSVMGSGTGVVTTEGNASSQSGYTGDTSTSSIIGEINTGENVVSAPPGYSGAAIAGGAVAVLAGGGSQGNIGHGTTTVSTGGNGGMGVGGGSEGAGASTVGGGGGGNHVTINVSIAQASPAEAERLAVMVKDYLDNDKHLTTMGRM